MTYGKRCWPTYPATGCRCWQRQKNPRTVQGNIERAIEKFTGQSVGVIGSGRTDSGVHALGQVASFNCITKLSPEVIQRALNAILPDDIVVHGCTEMPMDFHARYDVIAKRYRYRIINRNIPCAVGRQYAWFIKRPLDLPAMTAALAHLIGKHDFSAFEAAGAPRSHSIRHVHRAKLHRDDNDHIDFTIEANGFLRHMVRNIVGTLVDVGLGKRTPESMRVIREAKDRSLAGITAPAHGLFLVQVLYSI